MKMRRRLKLTLVWPPQDLSLTVLIADLEVLEVTERCVLYTRVPLQTADTNIFINHLMKLLLIL